MNSPNPDHIAYFGYGSLVNLDTLRTPYISAHRARLKGWRRAWLSRPKLEGSFAPVDGLAFLSVEPHAESEIEGIVIVDHHTSLAALDEREALYNRLSVERRQLTFLDDDPLYPSTPTYIYQAQYPAASAQSHILRSYMDAVLQGYYRQFGEQGVANFHLTTRNPGCLIREDRHDPVYPRSVTLTTEEERVFGDL